MLGKEALDILEISIETNTAKKSKHFGHLFVVKTCQEMLSTDCVNNRESTEVGMPAESREEFRWSLAVQNGLSAVTDWRAAGQA